MMITTMKCKKMQLKLLVHLLRAYLFIGSNGATFSFVYSEQCYLRFQIRAYDDKSREQTGIKFWSSAPFASDEQINPKTLASP